MAHPVFDLHGKVAVITGGCGLLGQRHARAIALSGGIPILIDLPATVPSEKAATLTLELGAAVYGYAADITNRAQVETLMNTIEAKVGSVAILINNAANNPKTEKRSGSEFTRFETFSVAQLTADFEVGLVGAMVMAQVFGSAMARRGTGVIVNVASDLGILAPNQSLYRQAGLPEDQQPVKPVSYSVVKTALIGLTRYLATYWAHAGVRVNSICPGGVANGQSEEFTARVSALIPMGRMARRDEY